MLPSSESPPHLQPQSLKRPKTPDSADRKKAALYSIHVYISTHPIAWLIFSILILQLLLLFMARSLPASFSVRHWSFPSNLVIDNSLSFPSNPVIDNSSSGDPCSSGKVYVYDLPPMFNRELSDNCQDLNPWGSRCNALANGGFGQRAAGLDGIVPKSLIHSWYWTDQFASEIIFHNRILGHRCRTLDPNSASAFYLPFYAGLAVGKYLWTHSNSQERDFHCEMLLKWVRQQPFLNRSDGWDHFMMMGRITWDFRRSKDGDWGSSCIYLPAMRNITRLLIERNPWDYFDVGVPYPTGFHPKTQSEVRQWQEFVRSRNRKTLFCFAGAARQTIKNDFRGILLQQCRDESDSCRSLDCAGSRCSNGSSAILEMFLESDFCLQPRGDSFTRRSIFDCMLAGSIPVFFWKRTAYYQYEWFLPGEPKSYSVFIDRNEVKNGTSIRRVLERFSREEVKRMREMIIDFIPKFVYAEPNEGLESMKDAFDVAIDGVLKRFREQWYKW
ncbi:xyloglucan galactosyltransferase XLT2 [Macadamia integrifolia]|uniref:xyloglucan galactosyltransferase XLT2 n=1 Tax=Macadamia integrifolia TaxID=60698 RepID=UPI001C4EF316|nr:xyloglucan galactosyltransferase XLT2 [Macadamia integrifolia]